MSLEQTMKWANEKINEQAVENGKLQQRIAELEANIDAVVEDSHTISNALINYRHEFEFRKRQVRASDEENGSFYTRQIESVQKALAAIEALKQPDSGEQEK